MLYSRKTLAGLFLLVGGIQWVLAIIIAEARYQNYSVATNSISDLGVNRSSALIFDSSTFFLGLLIILAAYCLRNELRSRVFLTSLILAGIGPLGVAIFNENHILIHSIFALTAFVFGGVAAISAEGFLKRPLRYVSIAIGAFTLLALVLFLSGIHLGIGIGGMERMVAYPTTLWMVAFGGYLSADFGTASFQGKN